MAQLGKYILFALAIIAVFIVSCGVWLCGVYLLMGWCCGWFVAVCAVVAAAYTWLCYQVLRNDTDDARHITSVDMM